MTTEVQSGLFRHIRFRSATALVVANIIGAGIFTTTGFQAESLGDPVYIFVLWIIGGILAFCGALCYAELGTAMPRAGAEYVYLREAYGPSVGFMSAFVSLVTGFSAPIASAAKSLVAYLAHFFPALSGEPRIGGIVSVNDLIALGLVWLLVAIHLLGVRGSMGFNDLITLFKVGGIVFIIVAAALVGEGAVSNLTRPSPSRLAMSGSQEWAAFGTSLIFVMFCYSGWNAAAYVAGEIRHPQRDLPRSLLTGTAIVLLLYLGLNAVYFYGAGVEDLAGKVEVGLVASRRLFGGGGVTLVTVVICTSLVASASAMTVAGPRVYYALGQDFRTFGFLARTTRTTAAPLVALLVQGAVTSLLVVSGRVDQIQQYAGFTLVLFGSLAVSSVIVLRLRRPDLERPFRTWGYPVTPLLFLGVSVWMMFWAFRGRPVESTLSLLTVAAGGLIFFVFASLKRNRARR
ncbi:MAG: APC family permease [Acidobacteria bacterium]|nr:APC family permease [Acidobacteriota bacterium]